MKKTVICRKCGGAGKETIEACDLCGKEIPLGEYEAKRICFGCWCKSLSDEDIQSL